MSQYFAARPEGALPSDVEILAERFGTKGAFLATFPAKWTAEYVLIEHDVAEALARGEAELEALPDKLQDLPIIVRSSIVGENIWDRGTYESIPFEYPPSLDEIVAAVARIFEQARQIRADCKVGIILQRFLQVSDKGTLGNLNRLSKSREHWTRYSDAHDQGASPLRFNSQRDTPADARQPLKILSQSLVERIFGSICRWFIDRYSSSLGNDRMLIEWAISEDTIYILQSDFDCDNQVGVDPQAEPILTKLTSPAITPNILKIPGADDIRHWDKLKILDDLADEFNPLPQSLYFMTFPEMSAALTDPAQRVLLTEDFGNLFGDFAVIRVSRKAGAEKTTNLPCSSKCLTPDDAVAWLETQIATVGGAGGNSSDRAFVIHKFIGARSGAWALYEPEASYIQIHANWGLPDSLQYFPYDSWEFHTITEEVNFHPLFKTYFLWPESDGDWTMKEIKNSVGRRQCLRTAEVMEIAKKTRAIGNRLGRTVAIMWFAGVEGDGGVKHCIPWYRTFEYATPDKDNDLSADHFVQKIKNRTDLTAVDGVVSAMAPGRQIALDIQPSSELIRDPAFLNDIISVAQRLSAVVIYSGSPFSHPYFQLHGKVQVHLNLARRSFRKRHLIKYHKLVRDKIPEKVSSRHERVVFAKLSNEEILNLLSGKLIEEVHELLLADSAESSAEEVADVYEILRAIMHRIGVDEGRVAEIADRKKEKAGGFDQGIFLLETSLPKPGESNVEIRDVDFDNLVGEHYSDRRIRIPLAMLARLIHGPTRVIPFPGTDKGLRLELSNGAVEISLEQMEYQLEFNLASPDIDEEAPD